MFGLARCLSNQILPSTSRLEVRSFAVRELPWCAPKKSSTRVIKPSDDTDTFLPIDRFGIVAAMSKNRVIGCNGTLPWMITKDRNAFKCLTKDSVLIIGRRTLEEDLSGQHISHAAATVVLSRTLEASIEAYKLRLARSFPEALYIAKLVVDEMNLSVPTGSLVCWVAGGEKVYHQALLHPNAERLYLTVIDTQIDVAEQRDVAKFPANYRWDNKFTAISCDYDTDGDYSFARYIYQRVRGQR
jgi:dihydrofolate reductase